MIFCSVVGEEPIRWVPNFFVCEVWKLAGGESRGGGAALSNGISASTTNVTVI